LKQKRKIHEAHHLFSGGGGINQFFIASTKVEKKKEKDISLLATLFSHLSRMDSSDSSNRLSEEVQAELACKQWVIKSCNIEGMFHDLS
jgi:hypothetical protein